MKARTIRPGLPGQTCNHWSQTKRIRTRCPELATAAYRASNGEIRWRCPTHALSSAMDGHDLMVVVGNER